jgi:flagellar basal body-associated protein FliL
LEVIRMLAVLFIALLLICVLAPWLGSDSSDARAESAHPVAGWFPPLSPH